VTTDESLGAYAAVNCEDHAANFTLTARSLGLATIIQAAIAAYSLE
jgi:hypothetical protein